MERNLSLFYYATGYLKKADIAIGNLEGPITTFSKCAKQTREGKVYAFRMPPSMAFILKDAGFDVLNTANNHSLDFGEEGRKETEMILDSLKILHTGRKNEIAMIERKNLRIGVIGFSPYSSDNSLIDIDNAKKLVSDYAKSVNILVVTFHGGAEGEKNIHIKEGMETFYGEKRGDLIKFAHSVIEVGADVVFGHGPHVPRAIEIYKDRLIAYSLGNFCTYKGISVSGKSGYAPLLFVEVDHSGVVKNVEIISFEQNSKHYPVLDKEEKAYKLIIELTKADFGYVNPLIKSGISK